MLMQPLMISSPARRHRAAGSRRSARLVFERGDAVHRPRRRWAPFRPAGQRWSLPTATSSGSTCSSLPSLLDVRVVGTDIHERGDAAAGLADRVALEQLADLIKEHNGDGLGIVAAPFIERQRDGTDGRNRHEKIFVEHLPVADALATPCAGCRSRPSGRPRNRAAAETSIGSGNQFQPRGTAPPRPGCA